MTNQDKIQTSLFDRCRKIARCGARKVLYPLSEGSPVRVHSVHPDRRIRVSAAQRELDEFTSETVPCAESQIIHWSVSEELYTNLLSHRIL